MGLRGRWRWRDLDDSGQAGIEHVGILGVVAVVVAAVTVAVSANAPVIGARTAELICQIVTAGTGECGGSTAGASAVGREPTDPCLVFSESDEIIGGVGFSVVQFNKDRSFAWEKLSDGRFRVQQLSGGDVMATAGVGAQVTVVAVDSRADVDGRVVLGGVADIAGGVTFSEGREWIVDSEAEKDQLVTSENWERFDTLVMESNPMLAPRGFFGVNPLSLGRRALGIGESFPLPDRIHLKGGLTGEARALAGIAAADLEASVDNSRVLGTTVDVARGEATFYFETSTSASAAASAAGFEGTLGAELSGEVNTMVSVTVDRGGNVIEASRTGLAIGSSGGVTNALFGGDTAAYQSESISTGTQYEATLQVHSDADRQAVAALLAEAGVTGSSIGLAELSAFEPEGGGPLGREFMDAVRERGDLTRARVTSGDSTTLKGEFVGEVGLIMGASLEYDRSSAEFSDPEYWNGIGFVPRTNC